MKICPLGAELFHADIRMVRWTDRQKDTMLLTVAFAILGTRLKMSCSSWVLNPNFSVIQSKPHPTMMELPQGDQAKF